MEKTLKPYLQFVEEAVSAYQFPTTPKSLYDPMAYILTLGGKRMRPVLSLLACEAFSGQFDAAKNAALSVELFHNFSLIHDDIMDKAPLRRGQQTVHEKWNTNIAILSGDGMLIEAYKCLSDYPAEISHALMKCFNQTATEVCEGQQFDMDFETADAVKISDYIEMIRLKTAVLLGCSLKLGAIVGGADTSSQNDLYRFGVNLGIAFQLQDDILDLYADQAKFGKQVGGDVLSNKKTYLLLKAFEDASPKQLADLNELLHEADGARKISGFKSLFDELQIRQKAEARMNEFYEISISNLDHLELTDHQKRPFRELADFLMQREH